MTVLTRIMRSKAAARGLGVWAPAGPAVRVAAEGHALRTDAAASSAGRVVVGVVPDAGTLLQRLTLPPAKAAVTDQLVRQQIASLLPGMGDRLGIAWRRDVRSGDVTVAAGPRAVLGDGAEAAELGDCDLVVPCGLALDALLSRGMDAAAAPAAWAVDCGGLTWLLLYAGGGLMAAEAVGPGEAVDAVFADLARALEPEHRPAQITWVGDAAPPAGLGGPAGIDPPGWTGSAGGPAAWPAAGAALIGGLAHEAQGLDLEALPGATPAPRRRGHYGADARAGSWSRWLMAGLWLVVASGFWVWAVASGGARQSAVVEELGLSRSAIPPLDRRLAVGRYLETSGPALLAVLDELGQKTRRWQLDELSWERESGLTLRGTLESADAVAQLARAMATMRTLTGVQVRRQAPAGHRRVSYTLTAGPSSKYFGAFVEPSAMPAGDAESKPEDTP